MQCAADALLLAEDDLFAALQEALQYVRMIQVADIQRRDDQVVVQPIKEEAACHLPQPQDSLLAQANRTQLLTAGGGG